MRPAAVARLYERLLARYGPQGWWPLSSRAGRPGYDARGYHPGIYGVPAPRDRFEVAAGAVLTQNTAWGNAEAALSALAADGLLSPAALLSRRRRDQPGRVLALRRRRRRGSDFRVSASGPPARMVRPATMPI